MRTRAPETFAAVLTPSGHHVIHYRRRHKALEVTRYRKVESERPTIRAAAEQLADTIEAEGGRKARVAIAISGFGSCHHLLTLPSAEKEVLDPILQREMKRFFPDLFNEDEARPLISAIPAGAPPDESSAMRDLLVGGLPRSVLDEIATSLEQRSIELEHVTVLPATLTRLYESYVGYPETSAMAMVLQEDCVAGFFHEGTLRLFTETPTSNRNVTSDPARLVADQVARGSLYLRQQFRGAETTTIWLGTEPEDQDHTEAKLAEVSDATVRSLDPGEPVGALLALGAALDAQDPDGLNLLPEDMRPPSSAEEWSRTVAMIAAALLLLTTSAWAFTAVYSEASARERLHTQQETTAAQDLMFSRLEPVVRERQAHVVRSTILEQIVAERERIPSLLWPLQDAGPGVTVNRYQIRRTEDGWQGLLQGTAVSYSSSAAAGVINGIHRDLSRELPEGALNIDDLSYVETPESAQSEGSIAVRFQFSFNVPIEEWLPN